MVLMVNEAFGIKGFIIDLCELYDRLLMCIRWEILGAESETEARKAGGALVAKYEALLTYNSALECQSHSVVNDYSVTFDQTTLVEVQFPYL